MKFIYTPAMVSFLEREYPRMRVPELTLKFNQRFGTDKGQGAIKCALSNRGIRCNRPTGSPIGTTRLFTQEQTACVRKAYRDHKAPTVAAMVNETFGLSITTQQMRTFLKNHKITCDRSGCFAPGVKPWNKGTHFTAGGRSAETRFRKGIRPRTWVPIGTEVTDRDGYVKRKTRDRLEPGQSRFNWQYVHVLLWEQHHGPRPKHHAVVFRNGDQSDIRIENLALVSRAELLYLNRKRLAGLGGDLAAAAEALASLECTRFDLMRRLQKEAA